MRIEITIDHKKALPDGAEPALEVELLRRLSQKYEDCKLSVRRSGADSLSILGGIDGERETIEEILQETWESADDWFY